jgi:hypothetical protein
MRPSSRLATGFSVLLAVLSLAVALEGSPDQSGTPETSSGSAEEVPGLPVWQEGDCRDSFEVRLWPARTLIWLERENLRDRIADPSVPESERAKLQQLLGVSHRWRMHSRERNGPLD